MNRIVMLLLVLLFGTSTYLNGQTRATGGDDRDTDPITRLLEIWTELSLSAFQVAELESIKAWTDQQNQPLVARMSEIRRKLRGLGDRDTMTPRERELRKQWMAEARPIARRIDQNNRAAMEQVGDVLTQAQKDEIARRLRDRDDDDCRERSSSSSQRSNRN